MRATNSNVSKQFPDAVKRIFLHNWRAKLMSLVVAFAVWYLIRKNVESAQERWHYNRPVSAFDLR